ncbi:MAG TPA: GFA family protein [Rubrivivax sp.]|nr:GFA family protein [Rubrivivax sp.]
MQPTTAQPDRSAPGSACASPSASALTGHCLCGAVTITVAGEPDPRPGACHCRMCQRWSGGLFLCFHAKASGVTVTGEVTRYRSSAFAERAFCPRCGSHLWFNNVKDGEEPDSYELMPGLFDAAREWPLRSEIYVDRALASARLSGEHRRKSRAEYEAENPFIEGDLA